MKIEEDKSLIFSAIKGEKISWSNLNENDSSKLVQYCLDNRIAGLIANKIIKEHIFTDHYKALKQAQKIYLYRNLMYQDFIESIANELAFNNINYRFLKGTHLNNGCYSDKTERYQRDIDILVEKKDIKEAYHCLLKLNLSHENNKKINLENNIRSNIHITKLLDPTGIVSAELHHRVTSTYNKEECNLSKILLDKYDKEAYEKTGILFPRIEDTFLHICTHGRIESLFNIGPQFMMDIVNILNKYEIDKEYITNMSDKLNIASGVNLTIWLGNKLGLIENSFSKHFLPEPEKSVIENSYFLMTNQERVNPINLLVKRAVLWDYIKKTFKKTSDYFGIGSNYPLTVILYIPYLTLRIFQKTQKGEISLKDKTFLSNKESVIKYLNR